MKSLLKRPLWLFGLLALALVVTACGGGGGGGAPQPRTYAVSGEIVDGAGAPIKGVSIAFSGSSDVVTTDSDGKWSRSGLSGTVTVMPSKDDYTFDPPSREVTKSASDVDFTGALATTPPDAQTYAVSGTIVDEDDDPIAGVSIAFSGSSDVATTGSDGKWSRSGLSGTVTVMPSKDDYTFHPPSRDVTRATSDVDFTGAKTAGSGDPGQPGDPSEALTIDIEANRTVAPVGGEVQLTATVGGNGADEADVRWSDDPDEGVFSESTGDETIWTAPSVPGTYALKAVAKLGEDSVDAEINIEVQPELAVEITDYDNVVDFEGTVALKATVTGFGSAEADVVWSVDPNGGSLADTTARETSWTAPGEGGLYTFTITAKGGGEVATDTVDVTEQHPCGGITDCSLIRTLEDLHNVRNNLAGHYIVVNDIDAASTKTDESTWGTDGFAPIGDGVNNPFTGTFDGADHTISGLYMDRSGAGLYTGLFGVVGDTAMVMNIKLIDVDVTGGQSVGGLAGLNDGGEIVDASVKGSVAGDHSVGGLVGANTNGGTIINASTDVILTATSGTVPLNAHAGGIAGVNEDASIAGSSSEGTVTGIERVGGFVGTNRHNGSITGSTNYGAVTGANDVGGLIGKNEGANSEVIGSDSFADVNGTERVGGLIGTNDGGIVENSAADGEIEGRKDVGGLIGLNENGSISDSSSSGVVRGIGQDERIGGLVGHNDDGSIIDSDSDSTVNGRNWVGGLVGRNTGLVEDSTSTGEVNGGWQFTGGLIGGNYGGLVSNSSSSGGVSGNLDVGGLIGVNTHGKVKDGSFSTGDVSGNRRVGGLIGMYYGGGGISDAHSTGTVTGVAADSERVGGLVGGATSMEDEYPVIENAYSTGEVTGHKEVGGLVGYGYRLTLTHSYSEGDVTASGSYAGGLIGMIGSNSEVAQSYSTGAVKGDTRIGGLAGHNASNSSIEDSYSLSTATGTFSRIGGLVGNNEGTIANSYSTGKVSGSQQVGGLVGEGNSANVTASYWDRDTSEFNFSAGGAPKTTHEMYKGATFDGWDFIAAWSIDEDNDYPDLQSNPRN